jgi:predicted transcriptional regulator
VKLARLVALTAMRTSESEADLASVEQSLTAIREAIEAIRAIKTQLTSISNTSREVSATLDKMREAILAWISRAEKELRPANS